MLVLLVVMPAKGQFMTNRLEALAKETKVVISDSLLKEALDDNSTWMFRNRHLHIKTNQWGEVSHIGYSLFGQELRSKQPSPIYDFLERYILEYDLIPSKAEKKLRLSLDGVICEGNPLAMIKTTDSNETVQITFQKTHKYMVDWQRGDARCRLAFHANSELLLGATVIELERIMLRYLKKKVIEEGGEPDMTLVFDRYGYVKDTLQCRRQQIIDVVEGDCGEYALRPKTKNEEVLFAINHELGFMHLVSFKPNSARLYAFINMYKAPDSFIEELLGTETKETNIEYK